MATNPNSPQTVMTNTNTSTSSLSFPSGIKNAAYYSNLVFKKYNRQKPSSQNRETITATIVLPLPMDFGDVQEAMWQGVGLGALGSELGDFVTAGKEAVKAGQSIIGQLAQGNISEGTRHALRAAAVGAMTITPQSMHDGNPVFQRLSQELGIIKNPHLVAQFEGVPLRVHRLRWHFSPRNQQEATTLGNIIQKIRVLSLPSYQTSLSKFTLDYPDTVEVTFTGIDGNYKTKIFKSAIKSFSVNLVPSGPAFYPGGKPVQIEMSMDLIELVINTREDFQQGVSGTT